MTMYIETAINYYLAKGGAVKLDTAEGIERFKAKDLVLFIKKLVRYGKLGVKGNAVAGKLARLFLIITVIRIFDKFVINKNGVHRAGNATGYATVLAVIHLKINDSH